MLGRGKEPEVYKRFSDLLCFALLCFDNRAGVTGKDAAVAILMLICVAHKLSSKVVVTLAHRSYGVGR